MIMDTNLKNAISAMREKIAELEKEQKTVKSQRKTVHFTGERTFSPLEAFYRVDNNKYLLRLYYAAYNLLRGKKFDVTESNAKPLIYDPKMCYAYPNGIHGQQYTTNKDLDGKHPLCAYLSSINSLLEDYGYGLKNYEEKEYSWGGTYKTPSLENYEEVICIGE